MAASRRTAERITANRGKATALNALAAACFSFVALDNAYEHPTRTPVYVFLWAIWMAVTAVWIFGVPGGMRLSRAERRTVNDELVQSHQGTAAKFGLAFAIACLVAISLCGFLRVMLPVWVVPATASATVIATGLHFAWLQLRYE